MVLSRADAVMLDSKIAEPDLSIADPKLTQILMVWTRDLLSASTRLCLIETV